MVELIEIPDCALRTLEVIYPTVDWSRVDFYSGIPWWAGASSDAGAMVLPDPLTIGRFSVFLGDNTNFCDPWTMALIVHEGAHVYQNMGFTNGFGLGPIRGGLTAYLGNFFAEYLSPENLSSDDPAVNAYESTEYEVQANQIEESFLECGANPCDCTANEERPDLNEDQLQALATCTDLMIMTEEFDKPDNIVIHMAIGSLLWIIALSIFVAIITLFPIIGMLILLAVLIATFRDWICARATVLEEQCVEWAEETREECREWRDNGSNQCADWGTEMQQQCCDWAPCSWFCRALVWVATTVCVGWHWVANLVCIAYTVIAETVCRTVAFVMRAVAICWWN